MFLDFQTWKPVILINLVMAAVAMTIPFLHRYGELAGPVVISLSELIGLFALTYYIGRDSGLHLQYFAATAAFFVILGLERLKLIATFVLISFVAAFGVPGRGSCRARAMLAVDKAELDAHYITAVITTFSVISIVVYYAFRLVEQAQAETDALLHNILPDTIVDRLKEAPEATIANEFAEASVLFADVEGFVSLAKRLGPARTVELLNDDRAGLRRAGRPLGRGEDQDHRRRLHGGGGLAGAGARSRRAHRRHGAGHAGDGRRVIAGDEDVALALRIGIASGPVLAGVIGAKRFIYDVWGDTGEPGLAAGGPEPGQPHSGVGADAQAAGGQVRAGVARRRRYQGVRRRAGLVSDRPAWREGCRAGRCEERCGSERAVGRQVGRVGAEFAQVGVHLIEGHHRTEGAEQRAHHGALMLEVHP